MKDELPKGQIKKILYIACAILIVVGYVISGTRYFSIITGFKSESSKYTVHSLEEGRQLIQSMLQTDNILGCKKIKFEGIDVANETLTLRSMCTVSFAVAKNDRTLCSTLGHTSAVTSCEYQVEIKNKK